MSASNKNYFFQSGGGGSSSGTGTGAKNYISNSNFETNLTTAWSLAHSTITSSLPVTVATATNSFSSAGGVHGGSAANGNLSFTTVSSGKLAGLYSGSYASSAATTVGDMLISDSFAIDIEDQAKVMTFKFYYSATSGTTNCNFSGSSSNSYAVFVYDVTNAAWIQPAGVYSMVQGTGVGYATGTFQTTSNSTNYQLAIINLNATAGAATLYVDDIILGPQTAPFGPVMTDWVNYTPVFSAGFGTVTAITFQYRREGDSIFIRGKASCGTTASSATGIGLPTGLSIDDAKIQSTIQRCGIGSRIGTDNVFDLLALTGGSTSLGFGFGTTRSTNTNVSVLLATGNTFTVDSTAIPVVGFSSNSVMSSDTDTRVVAARMTGATATVTGSYSDVTWTTVANDTHGAMGAINYTVPVSGYYDIAGALNVGAATVSAAGGFFIGLNNGSVILENELLFDLNVPENESIPFNYGSVLLNSGTAIKIQIKTSGTIGTPIVNSSATLNFLSIKRISGPAVIAATESVGMKYSNGAATSVPNSGDNNVPFATKVFDTHAAYNTGTGIYTVPVSGKYRVSGTVTFGSLLYASGNLILVSVYKNSAIESYGAGVLLQAAITNQIGASVSTTVQCSAGDTLEFRANNSRTAGASTLAASASENHLEIERIGN